MWTIFGGGDGIVDFAFLSSAARFGGVRLLVAPALVCALLLGACQKETRELGPEAVVSEFISTMRRAHGDPADGERAAELLWEPARANLKERARRASALSGRELLPGEMIVPSWFALHVSPERIEARRDGEWAEVTVFGAAEESVQMRCVLEEGNWRVALELPPLAPIRHRDETH
jgi:hypothetical protein